MSTDLRREPDVTILTGAGGWFGRSYLRAVAGAAGPVGHRREVRVLVPGPAEVDQVLAALPQARVQVGDVADPETLARLFEGAADASVVHAAGVIHPARVADFERVNVEGTAAVVDASVRAGVRRLVHVSSNSPFGFNATTTDVFRHDEPYDPYLGYGWSKMRAEQLVLSAHEAHGLETVVVRPPWFYGPEQPERQTLFFKLVRTGRFPVIGSGEQRRSMVYVDTLVQGVALAERVPEAAGQAFWVADSRPYSFNEIVAAVKQAVAEAGLPVSSRQVRLPGVAGRVAQRVDRALQARGVYHQQVHVLGEVGETIACDIERTRQVLGLRPEVDVLEGMRRSVRWCLEQGYEI